MKTDRPFFSFKLNEFFDNLQKIQNYLKEEFYEDNKKNWDKVTKFVDKVLRKSWIDRNN